MTPDPDHDLREAISAVQHTIWANWMQHLFRVSTENPDGTFTIPLDKVQRWQRQIATPYDELTEGEKDGDREQADRVLAVLNEK